MNEPTIAAKADEQRGAIPSVTAADHVFRWLATGTEAFEAMLHHIEGAEHRVVLEFYICKPGAVSDHFHRLQEVSAHSMPLPGKNCG